MPPHVRKFALAAHLTFSGCWIGAALAYVALGIAAASSQNSQTVRGAWIAMELTGWFIIVPLAVGSLLTGLVMALGTRWGLFRYYWVLLSFVLTTLVTIVLVLHMPTVSSTAEVARTASRGRLDQLGGDLFHSGLGLVALVAIQVLNVYKPPGMTPYGVRRQGEQQGTRISAGERAELPPTT